MNRKKISIFTIILLFTLNSLSSISFGFHAFDIRTSYNFANGALPTSLLYQFDFPVPNIINGNTTEFDFRVDNGIDFRILRQDPLTGTPFAIEPDSPSWNYPKDYFTVFNEMNLVLGQGFLKTSHSQKDLFKLWTTFDIRFENSYERFSFLDNPNETDALFFIQTETGKVNRFDSWIGQPELTADRSTTNISFSLGFDFNIMQDEITVRNGIKNSLWIRLNPKWTDWFKDGTHDYILIWNKLDLSWTPFHIKMNGKRNTTWFSLVFDNSTTYRFISGEKTPYYIQGGYIFGTQVPNSTHVLTNRSSMTIYGPQINSYDCYPYVSAFIDIGYGWGNLLNSSTAYPVNETVCSVGIKTELIIFNIASFYYEIGYVIDNAFNLPSPPIMNFGFSFGV